MTSLSVKGAHRTVHRAALLGSGFLLALTATTSHALQYSMDLLGDQLKGELNTTITAGADVRMESQNPNMIGKANLNPNVCGFANIPGTSGTTYFQSCQGSFKNQTYPAQQLANAPGAATMNHDDGDLNYNKGDFFQGVLKVTEDLRLNYRDFGFFGRLLYFHDFVNDSFTDYHPNEITPQNYLSVGYTKDQVKQPSGLPYPSWPASLDPDPNSPRFNNGPRLNNGRVYGPGAPVYSKRTNGEVLREAGDAFQYLDSYIFGKLPAWGGREVTFKLGRQVVNWGESTTLVLNSLNSANPVNTNNFFRVGNQVEEDFTPVNMAFLSFQPIDNVTMEGYYQLEWKPSEIPTPGTYFSSVDLGSNNAINVANLSFANAADDPSKLGHLQFNPLALLAPTSGTVTRIADVEPRTDGQYGIKLDYYADWLNNGTDISGYYEHYHSRFPFISFYAANPSCARAAGNPNHTDATNLIQFFQDCQNVPIKQGLLQGSGYTNPGTSDPGVDSVASLDTNVIQLSYPEDIDLLGLSFNTTFGDYALQGEVAYRPNLPMQVSIVDLGMASNGALLTNCSNKASNCEGTGPLNVGYLYGGGVGSYGSSDFGGNAAQGGPSAAYPDTFNVAEGALPGAARSFPNFVIPYRGGVVGQNMGCPKFSTLQNVTGENLSFDQYNKKYYTPGSPCWIRGWERFQSFEFNLGTTRILGKTENWIGADQVQIIGEWGLEWVPGLPGLDQLQLEAFGANYSATAGADGSGINNGQFVNGYRQACSTAPDCVAGPDGGRFNPHQQDRSVYPDSVSWGYRILVITKYENVLPGVGLQPSFLYSQDVEGTSPGPAGNFTSGAKSFSPSLETRYKSATAFTLGYTWFWGGGAYNPWGDRDFLSFYLKFQF
jgi:hypothetical protein